METRCVWMRGYVAGLLRVIIQALAELGRVLQMMLDRSKKDPACKIDAKAVLQCQNLAVSMEKVLHPMQDYLSNQEGDECPKEGMMAQ